MHDLIFSGCTSDALTPEPARSTQLRYTAAESSNKRKSAPVDLGTEDRVLDRQKRKQLLSNTRDLRRNFTLAAWIIRKHLDYVASFTFQMQTPNKEFNDHVEKLVRTWSRPKGCDISGRFSLRRLMRMIEAKAIQDGDAGFLKIVNRRGSRLSAHLQGIEGDRVANPADATIDDGTGSRWVHGIRVDAAYRHLSYSIHRRTRRGTEPERVVPASSMIWHSGYVENFDQVRGISPLASGLNSMRDLYENFDYALGRMKISQLFAFALTKNLKALEDDLDELPYNYKNASTGQAYDDETVEDQEATEPEYDIDFGKGHVLLDLKPGHDAKFLESNQPSDQFQSFTLSMIQLTLKALDIPYSFYSENFTNFFGSRGAVQHYERSCQDRREYLQQLKREITFFVLRIFLLNNVLTLPKGWRLDELEYEWVPDGIPWWDPAKEIRGDLMAIAAGLDTPQRICKERNRGDFYTNIDQIAEAQAYAREKGVPISFAPQPAADPAAAQKGGQDDDNGDSDDSDQSDE